MEILEYFALPEADRERWRQAIRAGGWEAGLFLSDMLEKGMLGAWCGPGGRVLLAAEGERLAAYCTLTRTDEVDAPELSPWIGFVFTDPTFRGWRLAGRLIERASAIARSEGADRVYVATGHVGLYEKYGFEYVGERPSKNGGMCRVYGKGLS